MQSVSAEADNTAVLRFFGWMVATNRPVLGESITFMIRGGGRFRVNAPWPSAHVRGFLWPGLNCCFVVVVSPTRIWVASGGKVVECVPRIADPDVTGSGVVCMCGR